MQLSLQEVAPAERLPEDSAMFLAKIGQGSNWKKLDTSFTIHLLTIHLLFISIHHSNLGSHGGVRNRACALAGQSPAVSQAKIRRSASDAKPVKLFRCDAELCQDALPEPTRATAKKKRGEPRGEAEMDQKAVEDAWLYTFWKCASLCFVVILISQSRNLFQLGFE